MTTEYKAYEANPLGYLKMAAERVYPGIGWPTDELERIAAKGPEDEPCDRILQTLAKTLSKYEPLPDPVEECLVDYLVDEGIIIGGVLAETCRGFATALRSAGLVKS